MKKLIFSFCGLVLMAGFAAGCNTVAGAGQDVADTGNTISHVANSAKP